jgi:hypothetical protein
LFLECFIINLKLHSLLYKLVNFLICMIFLQENICFVVECK